MFDKELIGFLVNLGSLTGVAIGIIGGLIGVYCSLKSVKIKKQKKWIITITIITFLALGVFLTGVWFGSPLVGWGLLLEFCILALFLRPIINFLNVKLQKTAEE